MIAYPCFLFRSYSYPFFARQTARLTIFQLPPYSPDDNPIEKL
jgi:transposase